MLSLTAFAMSWNVRGPDNAPTMRCCGKRRRPRHGGRVFGYDNVRVNGHVEWRINQGEAAVVRRIFALCVDGHGMKATAKRLNAEGARSPRAQQGRSQVVGTVVGAHGLVSRPISRRDDLEPDAEAQPVGAEATDRSTGD